MHLRLTSCSSSLMVKKQHSAHWPLAWQGSLCQSEVKAVAHLRTQPDRALWLSQPQWSYTSPSGQVWQFVGVQKNGLTVKKCIYTWDFFMIPDSFSEHLVSCIWVIIMKCWNFNKYWTLKYFYNAVDTKQNPFRSCHIIRIVIPEC